MPTETNPGMAFVLVQHLAPDHSSMLCELIQRYTRMKVFEVEDGMKVHPNCAYIIPPNRDMALLNGSLHLLEPAKLRGLRLPIDFFFRSLAEDQREHAICIILSGTGTDGTLGLRAIKGAGGMAMVQHPESTEFDGMPRSAIATGLVDFELDPAEMAGKLIAYAAHAFEKPTGLAKASTPKTENSMNKIFVLLRAQIGHDFSKYKPSTIQRRIERRQAIHQIESIEHYVEYLRRTPMEAEELFRDLLIGVTNFFRDPKIFEVLEEQVIPKLFEGKRDGAAIRVWSAACSTGEEAYSLAILLAEKQAELKRSFGVQIFATDIDKNAIASARAGLFPASIAADCSAERLARYFTSVGDGNAYRIHKNIRDMLIFSEQDLIKDPPFSRLDLISCRNLLIYLNGELQKRLIPLFHYALSPGGFLLLGSSETIGEFGEFFTVVDRQAKLYQRKDSGQAAMRDGAGSMLPLRTASEVFVPLGGERLNKNQKMSLQRMTEAGLLEHSGSAGVLVNAQGDILYLHGRMGLYLEPQPGEGGVSNILKMARDGLRPDLSTALQLAWTRKEMVSRAGLRVKTNGDYTFVNLTILPLPVRPGETSENSLLLVIFEKAASLPVTRVKLPEGQEVAGEAESSLAKSDELVVALEAQLRVKEEYLQASNEELETSIEELKSSNEEMQSVNEELQSTNEEMETSKEELQSVNEELATVNTELQGKLADLSRLNNDMNNLLSGTEIGTVFLDHQLRILRFTPAASAFINLIAGDTGRPIEHLVANLGGYTGMVGDLQSVLDTLVPKEVEVHTNDGKWYSMRMAPYRTLEHVIEGAVLSFLDITTIVQAREALEKANDLLRMAVVVRDASDAITVMGMDGRILAWNPGAERLYGWSEAEALTMNRADMIPSELLKEFSARLEQLSHSEILEPYQAKRIAKDGTVVSASIIATALVNEAGLVYAIATTERATAVQGFKTIKTKKAHP